MSSVNDTLAIPTIVSYCIAKAAFRSSPRNFHIPGPHGRRERHWRSINTGMLNVL
jgi:hypothetical protein